MNKYYNLLVLILISNLFFACSFDKRSGIWNDKSKELKVEVLEENIKPIFSKTEKFKEEVSSDTIVEIALPSNVDSWVEENFNSNNLLPHLTYEHKKNLIFKSKKILNKIKSNSDFEPLVYKDNIFFYDNSGSIFNYSLIDFNMAWEFNFYKKKFKNFPIQINFIIESGNLIVSDNLGYFYNLNIDSGKINWAKNYGIPFKSNLKSDEQFVFGVNQDNKFYSIKHNNGEKRLDLETFPSLLQSKQKSSVGLDKINKNVFFIASTGEIYSINYSKNVINWIYKTTARSIDKSVDLFFSSPIVFYKNNILISTSVSTILLNSKTGQVIWELPFSTFVRPIVSNNFIFFITNDGFILNADISTGKVIWSKNLFNKSKKITRDKIGDVTSIMLVSNEILVTTKKGYFIFIDYKNGKIINYVNADKKGFYSKPVLVNKKIYIVNMKGRLLVFN